MSVPYTECAVIATQKFKNEDIEWHSKCDRKAYVTQTAWNEYIEDSSGNYTMSCGHRDDYTRVIDDRSSAEAARNSAQEYVQNQTNLTDVYDAVLAVDGTHNYENFDGYAYTGDCSENKKCAGGTDKCTAIVGENSSTGLEAHEISHLYGGKHNTHRNWGTSEYTIMGNPGDDTCNGNSTQWRARRADYHDCAINGIRSYIDCFSDSIY